MKAVSFHVSNIKCGGAILEPINSANDSSFAYIAASSGYQKTCKG